MTELKAVLWDMDGTLIDSEPFWITCQVRMMTEAGIPWTEAAAAGMIGNPLTVSAQLLRDGGLDLPVPEIVDRIVSLVAAELQAHLPWKPGMRRLLAETKAAGIRCALVTMSYPRLVAPVLEQLPDTFDAVVTGTSVTNGKPHPEAYLTAMEQLGLRPEECLAIEDSLPGVASARASGAVTIAAEGHVPLSEAGGHFLLTDFSDITVDDLRRLHREGLSR